MQVLTRKHGEELILDLREFGLGTVSVMVVKIRGDHVRLGVEADPRIPTHRREVWEAIEREKEPAQ